MVLNHRFARSLDKHLGTSEHPWKVTGQRIAVNKDLLISKIRVPFFLSFKEQNGWKASCNMNYYRWKEGKEGKEVILEEPAIIEGRSN